MILRVVERFLNSLADATFWILIIFAVGLVVILSAERIIGFVLEDVGGKKDGTVGGTGEGETEE